MSVKYFCDCCKKDCDMNGFYVTVQLVKNPAHTGNTDMINLNPLGTVQKEQLQLFMCQDCYKKTHLPNPYSIGEKAKTLRELEE